MNVEDESNLPEFCRKPILILGCGNRLFGDDGFGPAVMEHLLTGSQLPEEVYAMDVGTGIRKLLFTILLSSIHPRQIMVIDAVDKGKKPGEIFELALDDLPQEKIDDFSFHQSPSPNLARELKDAGIDVRVMVCQVASIPECVTPGLSAPLMDAVPRMCGLIIKNLMNGVPHV